MNMTCKRGKKAAMCLLLIFSLLVPYAEAAVPEGLHAPSGVVSDTVMPTGQAGEATQPVPEEKSARSLEELKLLDGVVQQDGRVVQIRGNTAKELTGEEIALLFHDGTQPVGLQDGSETGFTELLSERFGYTKAEIEESLRRHGSESALQSELYNYQISNESYPLNEEAEAGILALVFGGYTNSQAFAAYVTSDFLGVPLPELISAKEAELASLAAAGAPENMERDETIDALATVMGVPYAVVETYLASHEVDIQEVEQSYRAAKNAFYLKDREADKSSTLASENATYAPQRILDKPFSYDRLDNISVNLNTGTLQYSETDLTIPGVNGLDFNFTRRFDSSMAWYKRPAGMLWDCEKEAAFLVCYTGYLWTNYDQPTETPIYTEAGDLAYYQFFDNEYNVLAREKWSYAAEDYALATAERDYRKSQHGGDTALATDASGKEVVLLIGADIRPIEPVFSAAFMNESVEDSNVVDIFGLGNGWELGFSHIDSYLVDYNEPYARRLVTYDGRSYGIEQFYDNVAYFSDYFLDDLRLEETSGGYPGASYLLTYKDGRKEYFDASGRNIAIEDRYGNRITLEYIFSGGSVTQIKMTDTLGNIILYKDEQIDPNALWYMGGVVHPQYRYNRLWTLSLNGEALRQYFCLTGKDNKNFAYQRLIGTIDAEEGCTRYQSAATTVKYNCYISSTATNDGLAGNVAISYVYYPNGLEQKVMSSSSLKMPNERLGVSGYIKWSPVKELQSTGKDAAGVETTRENRSYTIGDYSCMYGAADTDGEYDYQTSVKDQYYKKTSSGTFSWTLRNTTYAFGEEHLMQSETQDRYPDIQYDDINSRTDFNALIVGKQTARRYSSKEYEYDSNRLPSVVRERVYNSDGQTSRTASRAYTYDTKGNVLTETLPNSQKITYGYDSAYSIPLTKTYQQDATTTIVETNTLTTDKKGISAQEVTSNGVVAARMGYSYDSLGRLTGQRVYKDSVSYTEQAYAYSASAAPTERSTRNVTDAQGVAVPGPPGYPAGVVAEKTEYNSRGLPTSMTDANGNATILAYDGNGRITRTTYPNGAYEAYAYDDRNSTVTYTDRLGTVSRYQYDAWGNLSQVYDVARGRALSDKSYDTWNRLILDVTHRMSGVDITTAYRYDLVNRVTDKKSKSASGGVLYQETCVYDDGSGKTTETIVGDATAPSVVTTGYTDVMGNTIKSGRMLGGAELVDTYAYDFLGNCVQTKSAYTAGVGGAFTTKTAYDYAGRATVTTNALNQTAATGYDWQGNRITATDPKGNTALYTYDALGRLLTQRVPFEGAGASWAVTRYAYDPNGNVAARAVLTSAPGAVERWSSTEYAYDAVNQLVRITGHADASRPSYTQYCYDKAGNVLRMYTGQTAPLAITGPDRVSGPVDSVTKYAYDAYGEQISMTDAMGKSESYTYDLNGQPLSKTDRNGTLTEYRYDELGRVLSQHVTKSGGAAAGTISYTYTTTGQKKSETDGQTAAYTYDALGRLLTETVGTTTKSYAYNKADLRTAFVLKVGGVQQLSNTYGYDALGRLATVSGSGVSAQYGYDANGNRSYVQYGNGLREEYAYNQANLVTQVTNKKGSAVLSRFDYGYYLDGNQSGKRELDGTVTDYSYDGLGQLLTERAVRNGAAVASNTYTYDSRNNRSSLVQTGGAGLRVDYTYDKANRLTQSVGTPDGGVAENSSYTYDANGNRLTGVYPGVDGRISYGYDGFNRQTSAGGTGTTSTYTYGPGGLRTGKTVGGQTTRYVWDGQEVVLEQGAATTAYLRGLNLIASVGSATSYYLYNAHGDVVQLTDTAGAVTKEYKYDAFGVEQNPSAGDVNPFRYCGEQYDRETGSIYLRARYYDVQNGGFTQEDSVRGKFQDTLSLNRYTYCHNNPIIYQDPSGHVIQLSSKATDEQKLQYERAILYLKTSEKGAEIIKLLEDSKTTFTIKFIYNDDDRYEPLSNSIYWNISRGLILGDGKSVFSPALALAHEMGHGVQHLDGVLDDFFNQTKTRDQIEANNLEVHEIPIAKQLGEYTRNDYYDVSGMYTVDNSTDWGTIDTHPWWYYMVPWHWGEPSEFFENRNTWTPE